MGPYCGFVLQRLGADVVKVEPLEGEPYRRPSAKKRIPRMQFGMFNAGKRGLAIDLKAPEGRALFMELAKTVDVVLQNYGPGTFDRLVDVDELMAANPRLIVASGTGYGSGGPYSGHGDVEDDEVGLFTSGYGQSLLTVGGLQEGDFVWSKSFAHDGRMVRLSSTLNILVAIN